MTTTKTSPIDVVEAAYDLEVSDADWLPNLLGSGGSMFDLGFGHIASLLMGHAPDGQPLLGPTSVGSHLPDLAHRFSRAAQEIGPELMSHAHSVGGKTGALSEQCDQFPEYYDAIRRHVGCADVLALFATDPDGCGVNITVPSPDLLKLSPKARARWQMLAIHLGAGRRLRPGLRDLSAVSAVPVADIPFDAEAMLDPKRFSVSEATGIAQERTASEMLREAAVRVDRARGKLRKTNPEQALEIWHGLVRGRWSLVDWFDTDGRRFVLARPNAPNLGDPRGLTERELQVATYAARGESSKLISYRFGVSRARVSTLLRSAMRKLNVKTQAQLVERMRGLPQSGGQGGDPEGKA